MGVMKLRFTLVLLLILSVVQGQNPLVYTNLAGDTQDLPTNKTIVVEIFATWCHNCQSQHPDLKEVYSQYNSFSLYSLSSSSRDNITDVLSYNVTYPSPWTLGIDNNQTISNAYSVPGFPTFLVLDNGNLKACLIGVQSQDTLTKLFDVVQSGGSFEDYQTSCNNGQSSTYIILGVIGSMLVIVYFIWSDRKKKKSQVDRQNQ